jgi:hypothetical protein
MENVNEYAMTPADIEKWRSAWDGKWESIPESVHRYVIAVERQNLKILTDLCDAIDIDLGRK